jgi:hypothetical protein
MSLIGPFFLRSDWVLYVYFPSIRLRLGLVGATVAVVAAVTVTILCLRPDWVFRKSWSCYTWMVWKMKIAKTKA